MGTKTVIATATGATARDAFVLLQEEQRDQYGYDTGSLADKGRWIACAPAVLPCEAARAQAVRLLATARYGRDEWCPAGCIEVPPQKEGGERRFLFFGLVRH